MSFKIVGKYIKNINFEIPNSKSFMLLEKNIQNFKVDFDIKSKKKSEDILEIDMNLKLEPKDKLKNDDLKTSILFSTLVNFDKNLKDHDLKKIILIQVPKIVYPEIRNIIIFLFKNSGFNKINISEKVDFEKLYKFNN
tara:strand:- start:6883 stop:7296 length:414 start_codon:yes stop_codon:yes gene_type:complete